MPTLKQRLAAGEMPIGTMAMEFLVPGLPQITRAAGADFLILDMEHSGASLETMKLLCAASRGIGLAPVVRVAAAQYHLVAGALDVGAHGVMIPMIDTAQQAADVVSWTRYPPEGRRGAAFGVAHDDYLPGDIRGKMRAAAERTLVLPIIETPAGVAAAGAIAAVPGVDVLWLGSFDLTSFMGIAGDFTDARYDSAARAVAAAASEAGKHAGFLASDYESARRHRALGYQLLAYGLDLQMYQATLAAGIRRLRAQE